MATMGCFFAFVIKQLARQTQSAELHETLLDILLDTRVIKFRRRSKGDSEAGQDPAPALFISSWQQLQHSGASD